MAGPLGPAHRAPPVAEQLLRGAARDRLVLELAGLGGPQAAGAVGGFVKLIIKLFYNCSLYAQYIIYHISYCNFIL